MTPAFPRSGIVGRPVSRVPARAQVVTYMFTDMTPAVSVVVPTRNSAKHLKQCLASIRGQTYKSIELIVVDNSSTDDTLKIAEQFADLVVSWGPERCAQINKGASMATGEYVFRVDSDFQLEDTVVEECVRLGSEGAGAIFVHNTPDASVGIVSRIRKFEVDMYKFDSTYSSARFVNRDLFITMGGLDEDLIAGEDYDFQNRLNRLDVKLAFANAEAIHLGEPKNLWILLKKYYWYGGQFRRFKEKNRAESEKQMAFLRGTYLKNWRNFVQHPFLGLGFIGYHILKFVAGGIGYFVSMTPFARRIEEQG